MRRYWPILIPLGFLTADAFRLPSVFRIPIYALGIVVIVQQFRQAKNWDRWWMVGWMGLAIAAATVAEYTSGVTRQVMALAFVGALLALVAPIVFQLLKVLWEVAVVLRQSRTMLKDLRAGRWPPPAEPPASS